ncbi:hypothetical protein C8F01DRAFT_1118683 [Mycena amicta]|nr:hypothetical protein C8F01DRAFT_1118683 [Mycena amicta]
MPSTTPKQARASCILKFVVVGGGIAGLAAAYSLRTAGHDVVVVEKRAVGEQRQGSLRCPPNMTKVLSRWPGMEAFMDNSGSKVSGLSFRIGETSETVGFMKFYSEIMDQLGADFVVVQHKDLLSEILSLCLAVGVEFVCGVVTNLVVREPEYVVHVVLSDGRIVEGNIVVGADGHNSFVRSFVMPPASEDEDGEDEDTVTIVTGVNISIPTKELLVSEDLAALCKEHEFTIWMGTGSSMTAVLDRDRDVFNLAICTPIRADRLEAGSDHREEEEDRLGADEWTDRAVSQLPIDVSGYDPRLVELITRGRNLRSTKQRILNQEYAVGMDGMVVLVGDAAHSVVMHGSHNTSMGIEDAVTLGTLFSHLDSHKRIGILLETYEELRQTRVQATRDSEYHALLMICLPPGVDRDGRDETLKLTKDREFADFDDCEEDPESDALVQIWEQYLVLFNYDAKEAVDNWWSMWAFTFDTETQ